MANQRCPRPLNRLLMMRQKGSGPFFQDVGGACAKSVGNFVAPGMPGDGFQARSARLISRGAVQITFSRPANVSGPEYSSFHINGGSSTFTSVEQISPTVWQFNGIVLANEGDTLEWSYEANVSDVITEVETGEELEDSRVSIANILDLTAPFTTFREVGEEGSNVFHLTFSEAIESPGGDFSLGWSITNNAVSLTLTGTAVHSGKELYLVTDEYVEEGDTCLISYNNAVGDIVDVTGYPLPNVLANLTDGSVDNTVIDGGDTDEPQVTTFQINGGSGVSSSRTLSVDVFVAVDNVTPAADLMYQVTTLAGTPPSPGDAQWKTYGDRLDDVTVPQDGTYQMTGYAMDVAGNVSGGIGDAVFEVVVDSTPPVVQSDFYGLTYDPDTFELTNKIRGIGDVDTLRVAPINVPDMDGVYHEIPGGQIAYPGARMALDPTKLFFSGATTASSPDPLANLWMTFNDGSTWGIDFGAFYINGIASGVTVTQDGIPIGSTIEMFAGDASALTEFYCYHNQLTGSLPDLSANTALTHLYCYDNQLTGSLPDLSANTALTHLQFQRNQFTGSIPDLSSNTALRIFWCYDNQLTGEIPDLSSNTALRNFQCRDNQLTGEIPDLSANTELINFWCYDNQLTGVSAGWAWPTGQALDFDASINALTVDAVNATLVAADTALSTGAETTINLTGGTNAAPTGAGATAKVSLITKGASVTTN